MDLDLVSNLSIKPAVSYGDHMRKQYVQARELNGRSKTKENKINVFEKSYQT